MINHLTFALINNVDEKISFNLLLAIAFMLVTSMFVIVKLVKPALSAYKTSKVLEKVATNPKMHWFYGHMKFLGKDAHERAIKVSRLSNLHPMMFNVWRGPFHSSLIVFHPVTAKAFLSSGAPKDDLGYEYLRPWLGDGLLTSKGEKWKRHRMLLTPAFHFSILKPYMKISNQTSQILISKWKSKTNQPLEISHDISMMTLDTMLQCAMSTKTNCQLFEGDHPYIEAVNDVTKTIIARLHNPFMMIDWIFRQTKGGKIFHNGLDVVHSHAEKIIADRRRVLDARQNAKKDLTNDKRKMQDFLDVLLQAKDDEGKGLTDQEIRDEVDTFMFEGHDTTSSGLSWALYNLAKYPAFQEKCREEIQSICRDQEDVEWEDLNRLTYLTMFLKESMRLYPPVVGVGRQLEHPIKIKTDINSTTETTLPTGSRLTLSILALHRNPLIWENSEVGGVVCNASTRVCFTTENTEEESIKKPNKKLADMALLESLKEFDPERFSKENCAKRNPHAYVPFAAGSRNCIGQNFAMNEMKVALSQILRNFELYLDKETPEPRLEIRLVLVSENGIFVKLKPL